MPRVSVIIPAYNESERIEYAVTLYHDALRAAYGEEFELIILANGCSDNTFALAQDLAETRPCIVPFEERGRIGKGGAVLLGFQQARGEVVAFVDADGSTAPESLLLLLEAVTNGADGAIGSRWLPDSVIKQKQPLKRRILSRIFNLLVRVMLGLRFRDTQCGAKAFRREVLTDIEKYVESRGWGFDVELLVRLKQRHPGLDIKEVPIHWDDSSGSRLRAHADGPSMLKDIIKLRFSKPAPPAGGERATAQEGAQANGTQDR